jgi:glycosyltransferase involved in cell wall biosynthesis
MTDVYVFNLNYGRFLPSCLASIEKQNLDAVLLDGGSTDDSVEIAERFKVPVLTFDRDLGKRFNFAIEKFDSEYLMFLASDNILVEGFMERAEKFLNSHPKHGVAYGYAIPIDENGNQKGVFLHGGIFFKDRLHCDNFIDCSEALIRRESLKGMKMPSSFYLPDWYMWLYASQNWKFKNLFKPSILYRLHKKQLSKTLPTEVLTKDRVLIHSMFGKDKYHLLNTIVMVLHRSFQTSLDVVAGYGQRKTLH